MLPWLWNGMRVMPYCCCLESSGGLVDEVEGELEFVVHVVFSVSVW